MTGADMKTLAAYAANARDYVALISDDVINPDVQAFIDAMPAGGTVLDFGRGPGHAAAQMGIAGLRTDACDASHDTVTIANNQFNVKARLASFADLNATRIYDGIYANFSLLHASKADFKKHLILVHAAMKPGGVFHLGMKTGSGTTRDRLGRFYAYYSEKELHEHLLKAGFVHPVTKRVGTEPGLAGFAEPFAIVWANA